MSDDTVSIEIDGREISVRKGAMLIEAADAAGIPIPRFCYHEKLSIAANCRMCLVEVERAPKPLPACATPVAPNMVVKTRSELARRAQKSVMEFLLINHPLDCPICDQGGECELQDVSLGYGRGVSRYTHGKRVVKDKDIGPLIETEMTRCIQCTRCVRFGEEIAGMPELGGTGRGENLEIGTFVEKSLDSELSGNVIDLCPVGALTSKPYRYSARAWEMSQHEGLAAHDPLGSNTHVHVRRGQVMRVVPRTNEAVNEVWLSDRDRFSYEGLYAEDRLQQPMVKRDGAWREVEWEVALETAVRSLREAMGDSGGAALGALTTANASTEEAYLLARLARGIGSDNVDHRVRTSDFSDQDALPAAPWLGTELAALEAADAVVVVGANTRKDVPLLNHRLRKASLAGARIGLLHAVDFDRNFAAAEVCIAPPQDFAAALNDAIAAATKSTRSKKKTEGAAALGALLRDAGTAVVLLGPGALERADAALLRALGTRLAAAAGASYGEIHAGANATGAALAGCLPHRGPSGAALDSTGLDAGAMLREQLPAYLLLGVEPEFDCADGAAALAAFGNAQALVALTAFASDALREVADVLLPVGLMAETPATYVNAEGRWQSHPAALNAPGAARPAWKVLRVLGNLFDVDGFDYVQSADVLDELRGQCSESLDHYGEMKGQASGAALPNGALARLGSFGIHAGDALVRRAPALQATSDARFEGVRVSPADAKRLSLNGSGRVRVRQGEASRELPYVACERVAAGTAVLESGIEASAGLGPAHGAIFIEPA